MKNSANLPIGSRDFLSEIASLEIKITKLEALVRYYETQLLLAKRKQFGTSSEKLDVDCRQVSLFGEMDVAQPPEPEREEIIYKTKKRKGKRAEDLSGLPIERVEYELAEDERHCPACGNVMADIGVNVRRELELIPARVIVKEHAAHTYACMDCRNHGSETPIMKATAPKPLIAGSLATASLVAHIATQKYTNGMPLYRLENGFRYDGVSVSRQTMANWVIMCAERYLVGIYAHMKEQLLREAALHADETVFQVLREPGRAAQANSYEWIYRTAGSSEKKIVIYDYQETREQRHPREFLEGFKGYLHTDGYQAYHNLPQGITVVGCWAHVRRKWENLLKTIPKEKRKDTDAARGMAYIGALFKLEDEFESLPPDERREKRLEKSKPLADAFFAWAQGLGALPKSLLGAAVNYSLSQRKYLENIFLDGRLEFTNNRAERSVKPFVMGRKNWLFANTPAGAYASSVMYSILETAKENGLHPYRYMEFLLKMLPVSTTNDIEQLLPWSTALPASCRMPQKEAATNG